MKRYIDLVENQSTGLPIQGATVTVRVKNASPGTGALATIYSDDGVTPVAGSVVTTDSAGTFSFYAPDGRYDLVAAATGVTKVVADVLIQDITESNSGDATAAFAVVNSTTYQVAGTPQSGTGPLAATVSPVFTTPTLGAASATSVNKVAITAPATAATITVVDGKTLKCDNTLEFAGTDSTVQTFPSTSQTVVGLTATQTVQNKTLNAAANGNTLSFVDNQPATGAITGNGTDLTIYTKTITANQIAAGRGFRVTLAGANTSGATTGTLKIIVGTTTTLSISVGGSSNFSVDYTMCNASGVQNSQLWAALGGIGGTTTINTFGSSAENFANAITVKATFNIANPNTFQGNFWLIETIQ